MYQFLACAGLIGLGVGSGQIAALSTGTNVSHNGGSIGVISSLITSLGAKLCASNNDGKNSFCGSMDGFKNRDAIDLI